MLQPSMNKGFLNSEVASRQTVNESVDETVEYAKNGMEGFKKEEQAVIQEIREECSRQENQAAELNFQLQGQVEDLMEKLNKYSAPEINVDRAVEVDDSQGGNNVDLYNDPKISGRYQGWSRTHAKHWYE